MIGKLRAWLAQRREWRRRWRKRKKKYARWLAAHPGQSYAQFYVEETRRQIDAGMMTYSNIGLDVDIGFMKMRARGILATKAGENVLRLLPPLVVKRSELRSFLVAFDEVLAKGVGMRVEGGGGGAIA